MRFRLAESILAITLSVTTAVSVAQAETRRQLALISDVHFNPFDPPELAAALASRPVQEWPEVFATIEKQAMSGWGSDTNYALFASSLAAFSRSASEADLVIVPGDFLAHKFERKAASALGAAATEEKVRELAVKTTVFVGDSFSREFPRIPIIVALGNNDSDCGDYKVTPDGGYLARTAEMVRRLAGADLVAADFGKTYGAGGYYAVRHPALPDTQILVINDILWSARYQDACGTGGEMAAADMFGWLRDKLVRQKAASGSVWLVHHIPWGIDPYSTAHAAGADCRAKVVPFLREPYATEYPKLLRDFATTVRASFASHIHTDDYRLLAGADSADCPEDRSGNQPDLRPEPGIRDRLLR